MAFIVTDSCIECKHTDCVEVCPVDCFYEGPNFLAINPDECIDCGLCEPECPVDAIYAEDELPPDQIPFIELNDKCIKCKLMDCVEVCPVDCFYEGKNMLVIKPDECIDCGVCEPECPVDAITADTEPGSEKWLEINKKYSDIWPNISEKKDPPPDHEKFKNEQNKFDKYFKENL